MSSVYLICFADAPVAHAQHYLGFTEEDSAEARFEEHVTRRGARVMRCVKPGAAKLVRTWPGATRLDERRLKNRKNHRGLCPRCRQQYNEDCRFNVARSRRRKKDRARREVEYVNGLKNAMQLAKIYEEAK